jgi:hypothetical protein
MRLRSDECRYKLQEAAARQSSRYSANVKVNT